jgi:hypothetical protein
MNVAKANGHLRGKQPKLNRRQGAHLVALLKGGEYSTMSSPTCSGCSLYPLAGGRTERLRAIVGSAAPLVDSVCCPA